MKMYFSGGMKNDPDGRVYLWGTRIEIVHLDEKYGFVTYEYDKVFLHSGIEVSPICMPLSEKVYSFPDLDG